MATVEETASTGRRLIAGSRVAGTSVFNKAGEKLGSVQDVMIDKVSGRIAYAVLSFGGFLGIGDQHHPLPWESLTYDTALGGYIVALDRAQLEGAPVLSGMGDAEWEDPAYGQRVHDYYNVAPYWNMMP